MKISKQKSFFYGIGFLSALMSSTAQADCNVELPYEQLVDCIVIEGSGEQYNRSNNSIDLKRDQNITKSSKDNIYSTHETTIDIAIADH